MQQLGLEQGIEHPVSLDGAHPRGHPADGATEDHKPDPVVPAEMGGGERSHPPYHAVDHITVPRPPIEQQIGEQDHVGVPLRVTVGHPRSPGTSACPVIDPAAIVARTERPQFGELESVAAFGGQQVAKPGAHPVGQEEAPDPFFGGEDAHPPTPRRGIEPLLE